MINWINNFLKTFFTIKFSLPLQQTTKNSKYCVGALKNGLTAMIIAFIPLRTEIHFFYIKQFISNNKFGGRRENDVATKWLDVNEPLHD